jgi:hypothetical protein
VLEQNCGKKWEKLRHRVLEKMVFGIFGPEGGKMQNNGENYVMRIFIIFTACKIWE